MAVRAAKLETSRSLSSLRPERDQQLELVKPNRKYPYLPFVILRIADLTKANVAIYQNAWRHAGPSGRAHDCERDT